MITGSNEHSSFHSCASVCPCCLYFAFFSLFSCFLATHFKGNSAYTFVIKPQYSSHRQNHTVFNLTDLCVMVREAAEKEMAVGSEASGRGLETVSLAWFLPGIFSGDPSFCLPWSQSAGALGKGHRWRSTSESGTSGFLLQHTRSSPTWHTTERYPEHRYLQQAIKITP